MAICTACVLNQAAVEMPCREHCADLAERDRRFALIIDGLPCGIRRESMQRTGQWTAWPPSGPGGDGTTGCDRERAQEGDPMSYRREVLQPCVSARRWAWVGVLIGLVGLAMAALGHFTDASDRHADIDVRLERMEHDVYWCGQRIDSLRMRSRPVHFIAAPTGGATE